MEQSQMLLLAELPGLEAARLAIEARILEITNRLSSEGTYIKPPAILDPTILGRDILGRIKRRRNISPELKEKKRALIAAARAKRLGLPVPTLTIPSERPAEITAAPKEEVKKKRKG